MKYYIEFDKRLIGYVRGIESGKSTTIQGSEPEVFIDKIYNVFNHSHIYNIEDTTKLLLLMTKPPADTILQHLPFKVMFVDVAFTKEEIKKFAGINIEYDRIIGFLIEEGRHVIGNTIRVYGACEKDMPNGEIDININTFHISIEYDDDIEAEEWRMEVVESNEAKKTKAFCKKFAINLMNLIMDPEVELVSRGVDEVRNEKRRKRGKRGLPAETYIRLDGKRKRYISDAVSRGDFEYGYQYWVAGYYKTLISSRFKQMRGRRIWVMAYKRGKGILIEKEYNVRK